ncbi:hypothetical protein FQR65_LT08518 [Abscondita terminalis]|nr:hypothetical protein FQR65_LT08518 [Abscondita terminalis]
MRYPNSSELYPKDPYRHYFSDKHYFDLTEEGKKGSYALGSFLRKRYGELIGDKYNNKIVHTSSTLTNRTIMTAQLVLAGLFQDPLKKMLSEYFDWDSLSYQIKKGPLNIDPYQHPPQCMAYTSEYLRLLNSSDYDIIMKKYANFFKYVNTNAGITIKDFKDVNNIYQMLLIEHTMNFTLPEWAQKIYPDKIEEVASQLLTVSNYNPTLRRLNGG